MNWRWISLTALLAALVIGYGALRERRTAPAADSAPPPPPGYYLQNAVITQTRQDGSLDMRLFASRIEQRHQGDSISMTTVRANYFQSPSREWLLSAQHGLVPADSRILQLQGNVELRPAQADDTGFLRADALALDTERNIAYSISSPVTMRFGQHALTVNSFVADLSSEKIRLESANGRFEPR